MNENNHGTRRTALICAMTLLGGGAWAGDGLTQNLHGVAIPDGAGGGPAGIHPRTIGGIGAIVAIAPPKPPECTVTLTLPPGDVPIPERVDAEVRHVDGDNRSVSVERCKIVVRSK